MLFCFFVMANIFSSKDVVQFADFYNWLASLADFDMARYVEHFFEATHTLNKISHQCFSLN